MSKKIRLNQTTASCFVLLHLHIWQFGDAGLGLAPHCPVQSDIILCGMVWLVSYMNFRRAHIFKLKIYAKKTRSCIRVNTACLLICIGLTKPASTFIDFLLSSQEIITLLDMVVSKLSLTFLNLALFPSIVNLNIFS